ncbi:MAG: 30S ribosomal protein S2 [Rhodothalassiaceae bacterium]
MALPEISMRQLMEAGVHFGHQTHRWNPKMAPFIFGDRNGIHIIDLSQTVPYMQRALRQIRDVVAGGGRVLFVGTKRQAAPIIADAARRSGQYFVNHRWLGGMLTNWKTISQSIKKLKSLDEQLSGSTAGFTKKELLQLTRQRDKLELTLGGIRDMGGLPDLIFVIDTNREDIAIDEANRLNIPVVAVLDSNSNPDGISFPIPGNDDATRAIKLYCDLVTLAILDGISEQLGAMGKDVGESADLPAAETLAPETEAPADVEAEAEVVAEAAAEVGTEAAAETVEPTGTEKA